MVNRLWIISTLVNVVKVLNELNTELVNKLPSRNRPRNLVNLEIPIGISISKLSLRFNEVKLIKPLKKELGNRSSGFSLNDKLASRMN